MDTYNGKTIEEIKNNFPANMPTIHQDLYIENCKEVIKNEAAGFNLDYCQSLRNSNHMLVKFYLTDHK